MPTATERLKKLLTPEQLTRSLNQGNFRNFKDLAIALARQGADVNLQTSFETGATLLHILALTNVNGINNGDMVELVKLSPTILASRDSRGRTALELLLDAFYRQECTYDTFKQSAMTLARQGADITMHASYGGQLTLLHILARKNENGANNNDIVELVTLNPTILASKDYCGRTTLQSLLDALYCQECTFDNFKQSAMTLAKHGADITTQSSYGVHLTLLHILAGKNENGVNNADMCTLTALNNKVVNLTNSKGCTPIHFLLINNPKASMEVVQRLVSPANLHAKDNQNATLLHAACRAGNLPAMEYFVRRKLSLKALTKSKETLIHYAVLSGNKAMVKWLIDKGEIDINAQDQLGETALHYATRQNDRKLVKLLIQNEADITIQNNSDQKASALAIESGYQSLVPYLCNPKAEFFHFIQAMRDYGVSLQKQGALKGQVAIDLSADLTNMAEQFLAQEPEQRNFTEFNSQFLALLNSKNEEMSAYRFSWSTIITNITIAALPGIGPLLIAGKLIHAKLTEGRALFFFQKSKTTSEKIIADIEQSVSLISQSA